MWRRIVLLSVLSACLWLVQSQQPTPPVIADPCYATGTVTFVQRNVTNNCTIYYSFADKGRLRVDTILPGNMLQSYIGDWKTLRSFYIFGKPQDPNCFTLHNPLPVPDPYFFRNAKFLGRVQIGSIMTQHWKTMLRPEDFVHTRDTEAAGPEMREVSLFVRENNPSIPVRISFFNIRIDIDTFKAGFSGDPSIWEIPKCCRP